MSKCFWIGTCKATGRGLHPFTVKDIHIHPKFIKKNYRILRNKRTRLINAPPIVWEPLEWPFSTEMAITPLIIDRFSIWNQHWKAGNLTYPSKKSPITLQMHRRVYYAEYGMPKIVVWQFVWSDPPPPGNWRVNKLFININHGGIITDQAIRLDITITIKIGLGWRLSIDVC